MFQYCRNRRYYCTVNHVFLRMVKYRPFKLFQQEYIVWRRAWYIDYAITLILIVYQQLVNNVFNHRWNIKYSKIIESLKVDEKLTPSSWKKFKTHPFRAFHFQRIIFLFLRRRLQRIKLNGNNSRARSRLPFTRTLALVKIVSTWISLSLPAFHGCRSLLLPLFTPLCFRTRRRFNPGFSTRFDTLHSGLYALTRLTQHGTPCSYYCSYDPPILDRFILFHPRFSHYLVQPLSTTSYPFLSWCLLPFSRYFSCTGYFRNLGRFRRENDDV